MARRIRGKKQRQAKWPRKKTSHGRVKQRLRSKNKRGAGNRFKAAISKIRKLSPHLQVQAMKVANAKFIRCLCSAVKKLKKKRLSPKVTAGFQRNAKKIRTLVSPKTSLTAKRNMLTSRSGGFLPLLLAGLGGSLISNILGSGR